MQITARRGVITAVVCASLAGVALLMPADSDAIGSGGILNLVPQARVWVRDDGEEFRRLEAYKVYVHPFEGSLLIVPSFGTTSIALDKNKRHAIEVETALLKFSESGHLVDVAESTTYTVLRNNPHFNRLEASVVLNDGSTLKIDVER